MGCWTFKLTTLAACVLLVGCGHCYEAATHHLLDTDSHVQVVARERWPGMFGTIPSVVEWARTPGIEYGWVRGPSASPSTVRRLLRAGYRVVVVVPSWPVDHALAVESVGDVKWKRILEIHYSKRRVIKYVKRDN